MASSRRSVLPELDPVGRGRGVAGPGERCGRRLARRSAGCWATPASPRGPSLPGGGRRSRRSSPRPRWFAAGRTFSPVSPFRLAVRPPASLSDISGDSRPGAAVSGNVLELRACMTGRGKAVPAAQARATHVRWRWRIAGPTASGHYAVPATLAMAHTAARHHRPARPGDQPLFEPGGAALIANGEIYNYLELSRERGSHKPWRRSPIASCRCISTGGSSGSDFTDRNSAACTRSRSTTGRPAASPCRATGSASNRCIRPQFRTAGLRLRTAGAAEGGIRGPGAASVVARRVVADAVHHGRGHDLPRHPARATPARRCAWWTATWSTGTAWKRCRQVARRRSARRQRWPGSDAALEQSVDLHQRSDVPTGCSFPAAWTAPWCCR